MSEQRPVDQVFPLLLGLGDQLQKRQESGGRDSHPAEESRAWKMSLSANFPEEPWLRLRAGNGKCAGRRQQPCPPPSGEAVCKVPGALALCVCSVVNNPLHNMHGEEKGLLSFINRTACACVKGNTS